jgi:hypothetical protein
LSGFVLCVEGAGASMLMELCVSLFCDRIGESGNRKEKIDCWLLVVFFLLGGAVLLVGRGIVLMFVM